MHITAYYVICVYGTVPIGEYPTFINEIKENHEIFKILINGTQKRSK